MTVAEMLARLSSSEISMWRAYERAFGPLDNRYRDDTLAAMHEMLQAQRHFMGEVWAESGKNPIPEPKQLPRPDELYTRSDPDEDSGNEVETVSVEDFNRLF